MGFLKPHDPRKSEDERRQLGELQFRVETLIDRAQIGRARRSRAKRNASR